CCVGAVAALFTLLRAFIQKNKKTKMLWLVLAIVAGIAGVVVFLLTENMRNPMTFVDWWTLVNAIILILGCVGAALAIRKENREKNQQAYKRA
ncbi:MAG: hypothetical protein FWD30_03565, partial [Dehalococcoidia bacterium]|nr:hypothetical protein [Dehalococcoidia bacterium]